MPSPFQSLYRKAISLAAVTPDRLRSDDRDVLVVLDWNNVSQKLVQEFLSGGGREGMLVAFTREGLAHALESNAREALNPLSDVKDPLPAQGRNLGDERSDDEEHRESDAALVGQSVTCRVVHPRNGEIVVEIHCPALRACECGAERSVGGE